MHHAHPAIATEERMRWADVADYPWELVTTYENMHFCKPRAAYYQEILVRIGRTPRECMMVGNNVEEDLAAPQQMGMVTFLDPTQLIHLGGGERGTDLEGDLDYLASVLAGLPGPWQH